MLKGKRIIRQIMQIFSVSKAWLSNTIKKRTNSDIPAAAAEAAEEAAAAAEEAAAASPEKPAQNPSPLAIAALLSSPDAAHQYSVHVLYADRKVVDAQRHCFRVYGDGVNVEVLYQSVNEYQ